MKAASHAQNVGRSTKLSEVTWQFHCGNNDYRPEVLQLVRLDEILKLDPGLHLLATIPVNCAARRLDVHSEWFIANRTAGSIDAPSAERGRCGAP